MIEPFLLRAALAGIGVALIAAPMGCFVIWRRMAYFGDTTAHAALLGVALALALDWPLIPAVLAVALVGALLVAGATGTLYGEDTLLGVVAHGGLALALVVLALVPQARGDLSAWLFGDVLAVSTGDVATIWGGVLLAGALLWRAWDRLLVATVNEELAHAEGADPRRARLVLTLALAVMVAVALKVVGALLITAMLILPAAAARPLASSPEAMAALAAGLGVLAVLGGLRLSWVLDTPAGPSIVVGALALLALTNALGSAGVALRRRK